MNSAIPTVQEAQQSLRDHVRLKASEARLRRGGLIDNAVMMELLNDRSVVRYPLGIRFDDEPLHEGEFACLEALGEHPSDGYCLFVHPMYQNDEELLPMLIAYYIPSVNYGDVATHVEAELFGSTLMGIEVEEYYRILCMASDQVTAAAARGA